MGKKVAMVSLGCAKNQVDAEQMLCLLHEAGYEGGVLRCSHRQHLRIYRERQK